MLPPEAQTASCRPSSLSRARAYAMPYGASAGGAEREDCLVLNDQSRLVNDPAADERLLWESVFYA